MKKIQPGDKVKIIADTFEIDPHELEVGSVYEVLEVVPATKFEDLPEEVQQIIMAEEGFPYDIPERLHVKTGESIFGESEGTQADELFAILFGDMYDYANVPVTDVVLVGREEAGSKIKVKMTEDDFFEGYEAGDVFEAVYEPDMGSFVFNDNDGDPRELSEHRHEVIE